MLFSAAATNAPIQFGPYLLTECVGQGGMAVVYKATRHGPSGFTKTVVVKAMLPALSSQREFVAMFSGEARLMAALTHPNIVQVHDFGVVDGIPYLAMEYLPGRNLSQLRAAVPRADRSCRSAARSPSRATSATASATPTTSSTPRASAARSSIATCRRRT